MESVPIIRKLLDELERMPGIGPKSAQRIAYWMLNSDSETVLRLADAIVEVKNTVRFCSRCFNSVSYTHLLHVSTLACRVLTRGL